MRILLADDHDMVRETISAYLRSVGGADVASAVNLTDALQQIEASGPFDLVLLDYNMPGMFGLEGLVRALKSNGGTGVAILSGSARPIRLKRHWMLGPLAISLKPWAQSHF